MSIDDDKVHHKLIDIFIKRSGKMITHYSFEDGLEAYQYLLNNNSKAFLPDVILLDLNMPFCGWSFLDLFKTIIPQLEKEIHVIILSSSIDPADKERAWTYDCVKGFFSKPFSEFLLDDILDSGYLKNTRGVN